MAKVLVTGGLGFIGSHLVCQLLSKEHHITIVDNLETNVVKPDLYRNQCVFYEEDICHFKTSDSFDYIYHLANYVGSIGILPYGGKLGYSTIKGLRNILEIALSSNSRLLFVSSSDAYGKGGWLKEQDEVVFGNVSVRQEYAVSKFLAEIMIQNSLATTNLKANIVRPFNIVGSMQLAKLGFVVPRFINAALCGKPLTVFGDGSQIRAFLSVTEAVNALILITESNISGEIFNVGSSSNVISINELAKLIIKMCKSNSKIQYVEPKGLYGEIYDEGKCKLPVIDKIEKMIGWSHKEDIARIIKDTIRYQIEKNHNSLQERDQIVSNTFT